MMHSGREDPRQEEIKQSVEMLRAVIEGGTYEVVGHRHGVSRTAVERRIKLIAAQLARRTGMDGLNVEGVAFVRRLREHREALLQALDSFDTTPPTLTRDSRVLTAEEVDLGALRIKGRTSRSWHDLALYYILFATGLRPLEVARLSVRDYLQADGSVCRESELPAEAAINGRARPLFFSHRRLDEALEGYLGQRFESGHGLGKRGLYRGLDPDSRLFLSHDGSPYPISTAGQPGQNRHLCRPLLEIYRKLFRYAGIEGLSTQSARLTLMSRLYGRGADEDQVGEILGIQDRSAVREQLPRPRPTLTELLDEIG
jgi:integrase